MQFIKLFHKKYKHKVLGKIVIIILLLKMSMQLKSGSTYALLYGSTL